MPPASHPAWRHDAAGWARKAASDERWRRSDWSSYAWLSAQLASLGVTVEVGGDGASLNGYRRGGFFPMRAAAGTATPLLGALSALLDAAILAEQAAEELPRRARRALGG